ncbi:septum site-determining protein MinC [Salisediminibacterium selenitireducens]|uniref:Probable septum site-determining protein MinC n=1 Tax=Bacillus selenitireducens (strain ATCC 700615 / DSM 15326 / MLS10) TaxID=439292 RepID=D6XT31_BACIE|nr:septum site-determining protein MinC [Salisediminibacterium selenitireducens]ADH98967.1 Septum formation inhibitor MinC [[Bacillus] selenitireducens MLS10]
MSEGQEEVELVQIRGTKSGLAIQLDDQAEWDKVTERLKRILDDQPTNHSTVSASLVMGKRYVTDRETGRLCAWLKNQYNLDIHDVDKEVITLEEANAMIEEQTFHQEIRMVRSGQVLDVKGHVLLIGDVNPGGLIRATGNIYILGYLRGIAHAGASGNEEAVVCAAFMEPRQIRIATSIYRSPDDEPEEDLDAVNEKKEPVDTEPDQGTLECAFLNEDRQMTIERIQKLPKHRVKVDMAFQYANG